MGIDWSGQLIEQLDWHWQNQARPRLEGLTDEEYLWEPASPCWNLRPRAEARSGMAAGAGDWVIDFDHPAPTPVPVTTIAWRMAHIAVGCFGARAANHFGAAPIAYDTTEWKPTAASGLALLDTTYAAWTEGLRALDEDAWARAIGPLEGHFAELPMAALVLHINREAIHHLAEIALLRDLYSLRSDRD
jgi:hypothetical protein